MRFGSTAKVLLKCKLKYYRISEWAGDALLSLRVSVMTSCTSDHEQFNAHERQDHAQMSPTSRALEWVWPKGSPFGWRLRVKASLGTNHDHQKHA